MNKGVFFSVAYNSFKSTRCISETVIRVGVIGKVL
jgi:hypothetical protein